MFAVCGEALFDVFAQSETPTGLLLDARIGGSPFNVAVGLRRLGQPACLVTRVSNGFLGERLIRALQQEGVECRTVQRGNEPTTLSLVGIDAQGVPSYAFYGHDAADRRLDERILAEWPRGIRCLHLGSYAAVVDRTAEVQRRLVEQEGKRSLISYDPNVRLNVEPDRGVWRDQLEWMLPRTDLLKISQEDLELLEPGASAAAFAARTLAAGVSLVVVTCGGEGAQAWTAAGGAEVPAEKVSVVDTVGAGDTFQCALLTWLAEQGALTRPALTALSDDALRAALRFAGRAAAITCSRRGADLPRRSELSS